MVKLATLETTRWGEEAKSFLDSARFSHLKFSQRIVILRNFQTPSTLFAWQVDGQHFFFWSVGGLAQDASLPAAKIKTLLGNCIEIWSLHQRNCSNISQTWRFLLKERRATWEFLLQLSKIFRRSKKKSSKRFAKFTYPWKWIKILHFLHYSLAVELRDLKCSLQQEAAVIREMGSI